MFENEYWHILSAIINTTNEKRYSVSYVNTDTSQDNLVINDAKIIKIYNYEGMNKIKNSCNIDGFRSGFRSVNIKRPTDIKTLYDKKTLSKDNEGLIPSESNENDNKIDQEFMMTKLEMNYYNCKNKCYYKSKWHRYEDTIDILFDVSNKTVQKSKDVSFNYNIN